MRRRRAALCSFLFIGLVAAWPNDDTLPTMPDPPVHRVALRDAEGRRGAPDCADAPPFSTRVTCGACHDYDAIARGWHFNANSAQVLLGRRGEPWVWTDDRTATWLPLSQRGWPGAWQPHEAGLSAWDYVRRFARHLPGGGAAEPKRIEPKEKTLWEASGLLEIDCLACHGASPRHDRSARARQVEAGNFKWAATAASGLAEVGELGGASPCVRYDSALFDREFLAFVDIAPEPQDARCLSCHSVALESAAPPKANAKEKSKRQNAPEESEAANRIAPEERDVHSRAGLRCIDCHQSAPGHQMARGYAAAAREGKKREAESTMEAACSCEGCHLGEADTEGFTCLSAPRPRHRGFPPRHFERLSCTACHSGPRPEAEPLRVYTSRIHALGVSGTERRPFVRAPHVLEPVFLAASDGRIAPHRMLWPAYWARVEGKRFRPLAPEAAVGFVGSEANATTRTAESIEKGLEALIASEATTRGAFAYVCGGRAFGLGDTGALESGSHGDAEPYAWPLAHGVRPAARALGARGCAECHSAGAPFFHARLAPAGPLESVDFGAEEMYLVLGIDARRLAQVALWVRLRPWLSGLLLVVSVWLGAVLLVYGLAGARGLCGWGGRRR